MQLMEHYGKEMFRKHGIRIPSGRLLEPGETIDATEFQREVMIKSQILQGGRGKAGLVKRVPATNALSTIAQLREHLTSLGHYPTLLIEDVADIACEFYLSIRIDDVSQQIAILFSCEGGIEIESSGSVRQMLANPLKNLFAHDIIPMLLEAGVDPKHLGALARFISKVYGVFREEDALLIEINPLVWTNNGELVALDAKVELDDSSAFRHFNRVNAYPMRDDSLDDIESRAQESGITFVKLDGNVALLTGGAGLGMAIVDELTDAGLAPANFIDTPGGVNMEKKIDFVFERARDPEVDLIGVYIIQTAQPLSRVVGSLIQKLEKEPAPKPIVAGIVAAAAGQRGMSVADAVELLSKHGIHTVTEIGEFVSALRNALPAIRAS